MKTLLFYVLVLVMLYLHTGPNQAFLSNVNEKNSQVSRRQESAKVLLVVRPKRSPCIIVGTRYRTRRCRRKSKHPRKTALES